MINKTDTRVLTTTILSGTAIASAALDLGMGYSIVGLDLPAAWTAADLVFECSSTKNTDGTYSPATFLRVQDQTGAFFRVQGLAANRSITLNGLDILVRRYVKLRSVVAGGSAGNVDADANQGADRVINVIVRSLIG